MTVPATVTVETTDTTLEVVEEGVTLELSTGLVMRATHLRSRPIADVVPTTGQVLAYLNGAWTPDDIATAGGIQAVLDALEAHEDRTDNPHAVTAAQVGAYTTGATDAIAATLSAATTAVASDLATHAGRTDNPHATTAAQVGAYTTVQVDNIAAGVAADAAADLADHAGRTDNPHAVTAAQVGAYTTTATDALVGAVAADLTALDADVTAHVGRTDNPHAVTAAQVGAYTTVQADTITSAISASLATHVGRTDNPHAVTKAQVGLGNVEDTALSTWAGSATITTLGTITTGTVPAARVSAGTFGAGTFVVPGVLSLTGASVNTSLLVGGAQQLTAGSATIYPQASVYGSGTANSHALSVFRWANATGGAAIFLGHSRTGVLGSFSALQSGDQVARISFVGDDGTDYQTTAARITVLATALWSANKGPSSMEFQVAAGAANDDIAAAMTLTATALTMEAGVSLLTAASASARAGLRIPHGAAPSSPVNGDVWTTTAGIFVRVNGVTKTVTTT